MSLTPQFNSTTARALVGRTLRVASTRHSEPFDKGDTVLVTDVRYGSLYLKAVSTQNARALVNPERIWNMPMSALSLTDKLETDPPVPLRKPRMTAKKLAELKVTQAATHYIMQTCILLDFDFTALTAENIKQLVTVFNTQGKSKVNGALIAIFKTLPAKPEFKPDDAAQLDKAIITNVDTKKVELAKITNDMQASERNINREVNNIASTKEAIARHNADIALYEQRIVNNMAALETLRKKAEDVMNAPNGDNKIANWQKVQNGLSQIKNAIANLVNNSAFYHLESIQVPDDGRLHLIKVIFRTNDVWLTEANSPDSPPMNMGSYLIQWRPFAYLGLYDSVPDSDDHERDEDDDSGDDNSAFHSFQDDLLSSIRCYPYKNNVVVDGYHHPHVIEEGDFCWGNAQDTVRNNLTYNNDFQFTGHIENAFIAARELLKTYNSGSPYRQLVLFRRKQNPAYLKTLSLVEKAKHSVIISLDVNKWGSYAGVSIDVNTINPISIRRYRDEMHNVVSPELKHKHCYYEVNLYGKYYIGTDEQPREERSKNYLKLLDNSFVLFEAKYAEPKTDYTLGA